jgi:hypothetical protein
MEKVILIIFVLSTQSSYTHDGEFPATSGNYDTVQWWLTQDSAFRISTFARTNDIHVYQINKPVSPGFAIENTKKHYADIIRSEYVLNIEDVNNRNALTKLVNKELGKGNIEFINHLNSGFWNYDGRNYTTQTDP